MVEVEIFGLALDDKSKAPILVLKDEAGRALPIWIGAMEAMAISMAINEVDFPRPMTHDLLLNSMTTLGADVIAIEVVSIDKGTFYAEIVASVGDEVKRIDSRPSDAIALAVRAKCPIFVAEPVLLEAGSLMEEPGDEVIKTEDSDKWMEELDKLSEEDTKYKM